MEKQKSIVFSLSGQIDGRLIKPDNIDINELVEFLDEVKVFILSDKNIPKKDRTPITLKIEEGSLNIIVSLAMSFAVHIEADLELLKKTQRLQIANSKRAEIIEKWQQRTYKNESIEIKIVSPGDTFGEIIIDKNSKYFKMPDQEWLETELYLYGEIKDWGGIATSNIHIQTEEYQNITIDTPADVIKNEKENRVYKPAAIKVKALQNIYTGQIKDVKFLDFISYSPTYNEDELNTLIQKGSKAWRGVEDTTKWLRKLRGEL
ncbi:MAG: hypothetical protein SFU99_18035 [Saprospiraceae bacterium]|nr:hypothetical protein [Saprospiraceae bacterium]